MTAKRYRCIRCNEDARDATHYRLRDGSHEHTDCRARWEGMVVGAALLAMAEAIRERTWNCIMCEGDTDGDTCEWCAAPRGLRCPACKAGSCEDHVRSGDDRSVDQ